MKLNAGCNLAWPTPIYKTSISTDTCSDLVTDVMMCKTLGTFTGDASTNLMEHLPSLRKVADDRYTAFFNDVYNVNLSEREYMYRAWLSGAGGGYRHPPAGRGYSMETHSHSCADFIAVFYIMVDHKDEGGEIVLQDPRFNASRGAKSPFSEDFNPIAHKPVTGDVLIFPGFVHHFVRQYTSSLRLAIPVDIFFKG